VHTERERQARSVQRTMPSQYSDHEFDSAGLVPAEAWPPRRFLHRRWTVRKSRPASKAPICMFSVQASTRVRYLRWEEFKPFSHSDSSRQILRLQRDLLYLTAFQSRFCHRINYKMDF